MLQPVAVRYNHHHNYSPPKRCRESRRFRPTGVSLKGSATVTPGLGRADITPGTVSCPDDDVCAVASRISDQDAASLPASLRELGLPLNDVVVIFACNDVFIPYLSVAIQSLVEHRSPDRHYDIVILSNGVEEESRATLRRQVGACGNVGVGFIDVSEALAHRKLPVHGHFRVEMYLRLLAPELLDPLKKAVYLDCDLIILDDVALLFDTDVDGALLAATQDADTIGQAFGYNATIKKHLAETVGLSTPLDYFQSGVLVLNLEEFRKSYTSEQLISIAGSRHWQWPDQDVLNSLCRGAYVRLDMAWNTLFDWERIRRKRIIGCAPDDVRATYEKAREHPRIVHFAGPDDRPWLYPDVDFGDLFWDYASRSPYREEIERRLHVSRHSAKGLLKRFQVLVLYRVGMDLLDLIFRPKTVARTGLIWAFKGVGGHLI